MAIVVGQGFGVGREFVQMLGRSTLEEMQALLAGMGEQIQAQMRGTFGLSSVPIPRPTRLHYLGPASIDLDGAYVGEVTFPNPPDPRIEILPVEYWFVGKELPSAGNYTFGIDCEVVGFAAPALPAETLRPFRSVEVFRARWAEEMAGTFRMAPTPAERCFDAPCGVYEVETRLPGGAVQAHVVGVESVLIDGKSYRVVESMMLTDCGCGCGLMAPGGFGDFDDAEPAAEDEGDRLMRLIRASAGGSVPEGGM